MPARFLSLLVLAVAASAAPVKVDLKFDSLELRNGRKLQQVSVKSYDPANAKVVLIADRQLLTTQLDLLPEAVADKVLALVPPEKKPVPVAPPADPTELINLLGHPLPGDITLVKWDNTQPLKIVMGGYLATSASPGEAAAVMSKFVDDLRLSPKIERAALNSLVNDGSGKKLLFEIGLTVKNPAYASLLALAAAAPAIEILSKDPASGIIKLRNTKNGEITTIETRNYTAESVREVFRKFAAGLNLRAATPVSTLDYNGDNPGGLAA